MQMKATKYWREVFFPPLLDNPNQITEDTYVIGEIIYIVELLNDAGY